MIRAHFGLERNPFSQENVSLLAHQQEIFDTLKVHCQQGGLCLLIGEPGTGKSIVKQALQAHDPKRLITPVVNRTLHTYHSTLAHPSRGFSTRHRRRRTSAVEARLIEEANRINQLGKMLAPIIDDAHLMDIDSLAPIAPSF